VGGGGQRGDGCEPWARCGKGDGGTAGAGGGGVGESGDQSWGFKHTWVVDSIAGSTMPRWAKIRLWAVLFFGLSLFSVLQQIMFFCVDISLRLNFYLIADCLATQFLGFFKVFGFHC
jgi:hypothetical protein